MKVVPFLDLPSRFRRCLAFLVCLTAANLPGTAAAPPEPSAEDKAIKDAHARRKQAELDLKEIMIHPGRPNTDDDTVRHVRLWVRRWQAEETFLRARKAGDQMTAAAAAREIALSRRELAWRQLEIMKIAAARAKTSVTANDLRAAEVEYELAYQAAGGPLPIPEQRKR
jgi:hypothetical protein